MKNERQQKGRASRDLSLEKDRKFPESAGTKDQRKDSDRANMRKDDSNLEDLADDVATNRTSSRQTGSDADDRAGVSDMDSGMRRAEDM